MTDSERRVIERLQKGSEAAWAEFAGALLPRMLRAIKHHVEDEEAAEELASEFLLGFIVSVRDAPT